ncbi:MAG: glycoside hydrolase [Phycisphaerae bacterium SM1_79]|nr:MAG: glycoside hydrolase [Phycisphaerae bacterium SM1_79]
MGLLAALFLHNDIGICYAEDLKLNDKDYFETRGFNVLAFENGYTGMFFDEKTSGIMLIHHGVRTATGGAVRLKPTPEQWDQIPMVVERIVNKESNSVDILLRYRDFDFDSKLNVESQGTSVKISVFLDKPLPKKLEGRTGFNLEFLPSAYFEKTYSMDGRTGIFPLYPSSSMTVRPADTQLRQFADHSTFDDRGRAEYVEPNPIAEGKTLILAPEDPERCIKIQSMDDGNLRLLDGRNVAQNGWYVVRTLIPANQTGKVVEWLLTPTILPNWTRTPVIGYSQIGYHPDQEKVAVIELDQSDTPLTSASLLQLNDKGQWLEKYKGDVKEWGDFFRYHYVRFDFSAVQDPGLYSIQYGDQKTGPFQIGTHIFDDLWQSTLDVWFPVQMDHMFVNEAYRVWHGAAHLDDARQAPLNHQHFDGYRSGDSTETKYKPGERIPGLNIGGWFDAGDYDIRTGSHCSTVLHFVDSWEHFGLQRDETLVDQNQRYVDIHHPDGKPDILQQIEHGTLALIAQHRAFGRAIPGIIVPNLHQYHHLGDGSTMTDNLPYNPNLKPYESDGVSSGTPDDRWAFTNRSSGQNYSSIAALAAASRALRGYNDELADECLRSAQKAFADEQQQPQQESRRGGFGRGGDMRALLQLYIATKDSRYAEEFQEKLWTTLERNIGRNMSLAIRAVPYLDQDYKNKLAPFVEKHKTANDEFLTENPYGVPITTRGWAGNEAIIDWAVTNYLLHKSYPELIGPEYTYRGLSYIFGCHPYSNISFVSGVGLHSKKIAYGNNRADYSFIAGGVVPGILLIRPDFPENKNDWPFLWGENEYVIDICAHYILLVNAVLDLVNEDK